MFDIQMLLDLYAICAITKGISQYGLKHHTG